MRIIVAALLLPFLASPAAAYDCQTAKLIAAGKSALCRHKTTAAALGTDGAPSLDHCSQNLALAFNRAEQRFGAACTTPGDLTTVDGMLAWGRDSLSKAIAPERVETSNAIRCVRAKVIATGRLTSCRFDERARALASTETPDFEDCDRVFTKRMSRIAKVFGASCPDGDDDAALVARVGRVIDLTAPNVVLVFLDDSRFDMLQQLPAGMVPNLQRLADEGVVFENAFSPDPICAPSRGSMLTGLRIQGGVRGGHGVKTLNLASVLIGAADTETIGTWFAGAGRDAAFFGKYENGYSRNSPYQVAPNTLYVPPGWTHWRAIHSPEYFGGLYGATWWGVHDDGSLEEHRGCCKRSPNLAAPGCYVNDPACLDDQTYQTDVLISQVGSFIQDRTKPGWVTVLAPFASHGGHAIFADPAARHFATLVGIPLHRPPNWNMQAVGGAPQWQGGLLPQNLQPAFSDGERRSALESLLAVDEAMGELFDVLELSGQLDNTVIILSSDNGVAWGEHALWGQRKECPYEGCQRVPLIVRMPDGIHRVVSDPVVTADLAPTIADLGEVPVGVATDGRSIRPLLTGATPKPAWRTDYCMEYVPHAPPTGIAYLGVRDVARGYTYLEHGNGVFELYDLVADPWQLHNVIAEPEYEPIRAELAARLTEICS